MVKLRNEDHASFTNFLRMPPDMYAELLRRVGPRITKTYTRYRETLEPAGLKLALTLNHLAHGNKYVSMNLPGESPTTPFQYLVIFIRSPKVCEFDVPEQLVFLQELEHGLHLLICETTCSLPGPFLFVVRTLR